MWRRNLEFQEFLMKVKRKRENSLHLRSRHYVNFSNASLTIFLRQIEKGDEENGKYNRSKQR
uniref:Uncharacterized protein n=1 Tax=Myoviridae sp. ctvns3 TaxID=2825204 RepID=A0A8S5PDD5_9CAUD|nr:MAG TPA: hypothetical protein [Myoviridae sp. ctvns3]